MSTKRHEKRAFTLVEILVAMIFLSLALLAFLWMNQASNKGAMDAYYEFTALSLAMEPIEIFRGLGFEWLKEYGKSIPINPEYPLKTWTQVSDTSDADTSRPSEVTFFSRHIEVDNLPVQESPQGMKITVSVRPAGQNRVMAWLSRSEIQVSVLLFERPP